MDPLKLLIVAIRKEWQSLITESLHTAGYTFEETRVTTKQAAIEACKTARFDLVISNCTLPDGDVADLVSVLGKLLPCLVMAEGQCPVNSEKALSLLATDFFITSSDQSSWISAVENALSQWKTNAQKNLASQMMDHSTLHQKVLERVEEEMIHSDISQVLALLLEVLGVSRIYLYAKDHSSQEGQGYVRQSEALAPGFETNKRMAPTPASFSRWDQLLAARQPVVLGNADALPPTEKQWLNQRDAQSLLAVPILSNDTLSGFLRLEDTLQLRQWSPDEINLLESVAEIIEDKHFKQKNNSYSLRNNLTVGAA
jgi:DNA-binding NarL/FixJ family response regulator